MSLRRWTKTPASFEGDVALGPLFADRPPTRGLAGWTDWLLGEPLADALLAKRVVPQPGERLLIAGRPPFMVGKIVFVGCAAPAKDAKTAGDLADHFAQAVAGLGARRMLVEAPYQDSGYFVSRLASHLGREVELFAYVSETPCRT